MKLSINSHLINKNESGAASFANGFQSVDISLQELAAEISKGHAFSYQFKNEQRKTENFLCSDIIAADIDDGISLEEAMNNEFILNNAAILYTTRNHTVEENRFRLVFQLTRTITAPEEIRFAQRGFARKFRADIAATDSARMFYGNAGVIPHVFGKILSEQILDELIALGKAEADLLGSGGSQAKNIYSSQRSYLFVKNGTLIKTASGERKSITELDAAKPVFCPFHEDKNPSAFATRSRLNWPGIHCAACQQTFWLEGKRPEVNFYTFDDKAIERSRYPSGFPVPAPAGIDLGDIAYTKIFSSRYISDVLTPKDLQLGPTLIKSPKGTGKTRFLKNLIKHFKDKKISVLLIGHRRSLLKALAEELGLALYLDDNDQPRSDLVEKYYAISVDSMIKQLQPSRDKFDVVLIDESEQVLSHLISDTLDGTKKKRCYQLLEFYIRQAKYTVCLDADLNHVTLHAVRCFGSYLPIGDEEITYVLNQYKFENSILALYLDENHLVAEMMQMLRDEENVFVCCNSKSQAQALGKCIADEFGDRVPVFLLTADNSSSEESSRFIKDIKNQILKYRVVIVSPAMGTGIDVTFPDNVSHFHVVGFFKANIVPHYEIDQQISRVRHPKSVKVWLSPEVLNFETEVGPIQHELALSGVVSDGLKGYDSYGKPEIDLADNYLILYATIIASQRASKNDLKKHFRKLKEYNGWTINEIETDKNMASKGRHVLNKGKTLSEEEYVELMMTAQKINSVEAENLRRLRESQSLPFEDQRALDRYFMEDFYQQKMTPDLIALDNHGYYQYSIRLYENILPKIDSSYGQKESILRDAFKAAGLMNGIGHFDDQKVLSADSLKDFIQYCQVKEVAINRLCGIEVRRDLTTKPIIQLKMLLKECGLSLVSAGQKSIGKTKVYRYKLDPASHGKIKYWVQRRKQTSVHESEADDEISSA